MSIAAPPNTSVDAGRGVVTFGNLTLAFHLAPNDTSNEPSWDVPLPSGWSGGQLVDEAAAEQLRAAAERLRSAAAGPGAARSQRSDPPSELGALRRRLAEGAAMGAPGGSHLFTVGISGEIVASRLSLEPDIPDRPEGYRLGITMALVLDSLRTQVPPLSVQWNGSQAILLVSTAT